MNNDSQNTPAAASEPSRSTGPRTAAGKAVASQNARKHDLCSRTLRLSPEEWVEYNEMCERYRRDLQPADDVEQTLIDEILFNYWRLQQAREAELTIIDEHPTELPIIALYIRYRTGYERGYYKALDKLQQTQRIRKQNAKAGTVRSVKPAAPLAAGIRSTDSQPLLQQNLEEQINDHILENRVRGELCLPPLPLPKELKQQVDQFVSQNPAAMHDRLVELMKKAA